MPNTLLNVLLLMCINYFTRAVFGLCLISMAGLSNIGCSTRPDSTIVSEETMVESHTSTGGTHFSAEGERSLGTLNLTANGEALVQEGFMSRDGWAIAFDHVYLTVVDVVASQSQETGAKTENDAAQWSASFLDSPVTVDLVTPLREPTAVLVGHQTVPTGYYTALNWSMASASASDAKAQSGLRLLGRATKDSRVIDFDLRLAPGYRYTCGAFIGDTRKGFVAEGDSGEVEMTIHMDHLFGDATLPSDDGVNQESLGFDPLAAIAQTTQLTADQAALKAALSSTDYDRLLGALLSMGHVGEGHCKVTKR